MTDLKSADRRRQLEDTRRRLTQLEAEMHRLRAQLARFEADGEDQAAEQLEAQLAELADRRAVLSDLRTPTADPDTIAESSTDERLPLKQSEATPTPFEPLPDLSAPGRQPPSPRAAAKRTWRWGGPPLAVSIGLHVLLVLFFSFWTFVTLQDPPHFLHASPPEGSDEFFDDFTAVDFTPLDLEELEIEELTELEPAEVPHSDLSDLDSPWDEAPVGELDLAPGMAAALSVDAADLLLGESGGEPSTAGVLGARPQGGGPPGSAKFFGAKSRGDRFVFVVDNSGSMQDGRLETTLMELQQAVEGMSAKQHFYVIFFSDQAYPMFYPQPVEEMLPATRGNKQRLSAWLATVEMCLGGKVQEAIEMAAGLEPNVVYLLSDGAINSERTLSFLTRENDWEFVIHTLGMTVRNAEAAGKLTAIAQANGGAFKPVGVYPAAARMALQRPIPYHNDGPGQVWGTKVRKRN